MHQDTHIPSTQVTQILMRATPEHGKPAAIRSDNGPEFTAQHFQSWLHNNQIKWSQIEPASPQQNSIIERFNRTFREDILDAHCFKTLAEAREIAAEWKREYNEERPHESIGQKTPHSLRYQVFEGMD